MFKKEFAAKKKKKIDSAMDRYDCEPHCDIATSWFFWSTATATATATAIFIHGDNQVGRKGLILPSIPCMKCLRFCQKWLLPIQHFKFENSWNLTIKKGASEFKNPIEDPTKQGILKLPASWQQKFLAAILPNKQDLKKVESILTGTMNEDVASTLCYGFSPCVGLG